MNGTTNHLFPRDEGFDVSTWVSRNLSDTSSSKMHAEDSASSIGTSGALNETVSYVSEGEAVVTGIALSTIALLTVAGNVLVILSVFSNRSLRIAPNYLLVSLAATDISVALLVFPFHITTCVIGRWVFGATMCQVWVAMNLLFCSASITHMCAIALDRYWAIKNPFKYGKRRTVRTVLTIVTIIWVGSIGLSSLTVFRKWKLTDRFIKMSICTTRSLQNRVITAFICFYYVVLVVATFMYARLFITVRRRLRDTRGDVKWATKTTSPTDDTSRIQSRTADGDQATVVTPDRARQTIGHAMENGGTPTNSGSGDCEWETDITPACHSDQVLTSGAGGVKAGGPNLPGCGGDRCYLEECTSHRFPEGCEETRSDDEMGGEAANTNEATTIVVETFKSEGSPTAMPAGILNTILDFNEAKQRHSLKKERRLARTIGVIMGALVLCWLPYAILNIIPLVNSSISPSQKLRNFILWLGYINSTLNPFIYTTFNKEFRASFKKLLRISHITCRFRAIWDNFSQSNLCKLIKGK